MQAMAILVVLGRAIIVIRRIILSFSMATILWDNVGCIIHMTIGEMLMVRLQISSIRELPILVAGARVEL